MSIVAKQSPISATAEHLFLKKSPKPTDSVNTETVTTLLSCLAFSGLVLEIRICENRGEEGAKIEPKIG